MRAARALLLLPLLGGMGCKDDGPKPEDTSTTAEATLPSACDDPSLTWEGFAQPFFSSWCTSCHGSALVGLARHGAPEGIDFDTLEATIPFSPLIELVAVDALTMPPTDAIEPAHRARLADWIACGTPGVDVPPPQLLFCDDPQFFEGSVTTSALPAGACSEWNAITGDATIDASSPLSDCLCEVGGSVVVTSPEDVSLPELVTVGGDLRLEGSVATTALELPFLTTVGGSIFVTDDPALTRVDLARLETLGGGLLVARNPVLSDMVSMQSVATVGDGVQFIDLDALVSLDATPRALTIGGRIVVSDNDLLERVWLAEGLTTNTIGIEISLNPMLGRIEGLTRLETVGDLTLTRLPELLALPVFQQLESADSVVISETRVLTSLFGLDHLQSVAGLLEVRANSALTDVDALVRVENIGGGLTVRDNLLLPTSAVDALVETIGLENISGAVDTAGNGPG
ncbi:MAG: hypothetical protein H0V89_05025 [Deltaproteobacteria bacterium]|nr:hypothetical protein [Deltaproteobacteria bacterium]